MAHQQQPPPGPAMMKTEDTNADLASISVTSRIPDFWPEMPRLWFGQFESIVAPQKQSDERKYDLVIAKLGRDALQQVSDIVFAPPSANRYQTIKERLLTAYEESAEKQFQKMISGMDLGSQKPSQLLRRMRECGRNVQTSEATLKNLWFSRLPSSVRAVLTVSQNQDLEDLSKIADKIMENIVGAEVAEIASGSSSVTPNLPVFEIATQMKEMKMEIAALREEVKSQQYRRSPFRGRGRGQNSRNRSNSRSQSRSRNPGDPGWLCTHHFRYRSRAWKCEKPCAWRSSSSPAKEKSEN